MTNRKPLPPEQAQEIYRKYQTKHLNDLERLNHTGPMVQLMDNVPGLALITDSALVDNPSDSRIWCMLPYKLSRTNKLGCPNYGNERHLKGIPKELRNRVIRECPPSKYTTKEIFDFDLPMYVIFSIYPLGETAERLRTSSPNLTTPGQWYNVRYWQDDARYNYLYSRMIDFLNTNDHTIVDLCPEAHGVDLTEVMEHIGISLQFGEWPPEHRLDNIAYQICMGGYPNPDNNELMAHLVHKYQL